MELKMTGVEGFVEPREMEYMESMVREANEALLSGEGPGSDYLGWIDLPVNYDREEFARIKMAAEKIQNNSQVLVVIGIGGSYLGARAAIEFTKGNMYNSIRAQGIPEVYFAGRDISSTHLSDIIQAIGTRDFSVNVISKSGTTLEPAIAFRVFKGLIEQKYGKDGARERIFVTTDKEQGLLKSLADDRGYETFTVPGDIGGRFSVLSAVGLLPMAVAGVDIDKAMRGAADAHKALKTGDIASNAAFCYAALRNILYRKGKLIEILVNYEPSLIMLGEWFKQLFDESEGKDQKGIFATSANFSTDLHSIGQYIQEGSRNIFETVVWVKHARSDYIIEKTDEEDGLNYLEGKSMQCVNSKAYAGTMMAHMDGGTPIVVLEIDHADAYHFGYLVYFFQKACGLSGYLMGINPFDQPGVEAYKCKMLCLLGKPGFEAHCQLRQEAENKETQQV